MFLSFSKTLKKMGSFRLGFGMRMNKKNAIFVCFAMLFVWTFQLMWYMIVGAGWLLYAMLYALYKIYYFLFKYCAIGIKKLYGAIVRKKDVPAADEAPATATVGTVSSPKGPAEAVSAPAPEDEEEAAVKYVFAALEEGGVDTSALFFDRTAEYLKIVADKRYQLCFCRVKMSGQSRYIELTISAKDAKAYANDPRFNGIKLADKRFTRISIASAEDIPQYADIIRLAYVWGTTTA